MILAETISPFVLKSYEWNIVEFRKITIVCEKLCSFAIEKHLTIKTS
jgi:hypothetical protein